MEKEEERKRIAAFEAKIRKKEEKAHFDLEGELKKINCEIHYEAMLAAGLQDEGSFAHVEEETLAGEGLWIPRLARIRILSLRDAFMRKQEMVYQAKHGSHYGEVEEFGRERVDASGRHFKTKKELEDYYRKEKEEEEARLKRLRDGIQPKPHAKALQEKIDKIRSDEARDEEGMLIKDADRVIYLPSEFCCKAHHVQSAKNREHFLKVRERANLAEFQVAIAAADSYGNGFMPREVLEQVARLQCDKLLRGTQRPAQVQESDSFTIARIRPVGPSDRSPEASPMRPARSRGHPLGSEEERKAREEKWKMARDSAYAKVTKVLDSCLLSAAEQESQVSWGGPKEMYMNVGGIATERYDVGRFVDKVMDVLRDIDIDRYFEVSRF